MDKLVPTDVEGYIINIHYRYIGYEEVHSLPLILLDELSINGYALKGHYTDGGLSYLRHQVSLRLGEGGSEFDANFIVLVSIRLIGFLE